MLLCSNEIFIAVRCFAYIVDRIALSVTETLQVQVPLPPSWTPTRSRPHIVPEKTRHASLEVLPLSDFENIRDHIVTKMASNIPLSIAWAQLLLEINTALEYNRICMLNHTEFFQSVLVKSQAYRLKFQQKPMTLAFGNHFTLYSGDHTA